MAPKRKTAEELLSDLASDPAFQRKIRADELRRDEIESELSKEQSKLVGELSSTGVNVKTVWDLVNQSSSYPKAIPILTRHLEIPYSVGVKEGIIRALAVPGARAAWPTLVQMYASTSEAHDPRIKDALAVAIAGSSSSETLDDLISLVQDHSHGKSRIFLLSPLRRSRSQKARLALAQLSEDPDLRPELTAHRNASRMSSRIDKRA